jgi:AhpC/TSA family protein
MVLGLRPDAQDAFLRAILMILMAAVLVEGQKQSLPKPQVAEAIGAQVPDFTLKDQDGTDFHLAKHRGERMLLYFYRGLVSILHDADEGVREAQKRSRRAPSPSGVYQR